MCIFELQSSAKTLDSHLHRNGILDVKSVICLPLKFKSTHHKGIQISITSSDEIDLYYVHKSQSMEILCCYDSPRKCYYTQEKSIR